MITIPTKAIIIPTYTAPEVDDLQAVQYFDIVYYQQIDWEVMFHSMSTTVPLDELQPHLKQMKELKVAVELHMQTQDDAHARAMVAQMKKAKVPFKALA